MWLQVDLSMWPGGGTPFGFLLSYFFFGARPSNGRRAAARSAVLTVRLAAALTLLAVVVPLASLDVLSVI